MFVSFLFQKALGLEKLSEERQKIKKINKLKEIIFKNYIKELVEELTRRLIVRISCKHAADCG